MPQHLAQAQSSYKDFKLVANMPHKILQKTDYFTIDITNNGGKLV